MAQSTFRPKAKYPTPQRVLLAEDDDAFRRLLQSYLERRGYWVDTVSNGLELMEALRDLLLDGQSQFDVLISDICMPEWSGVQVLNGLRCAGCRMPAILITSSQTSEASLLATELEAHLLLKPFELGELVRTLELVRQPLH